MKITKDKDWYYRAYILTAIVAWIFCFFPTIVAAFIELPLFVQKDAETTLTGTFALALICAAYPLIKGFLQYMKSPSAPVLLWLIFFVLTMLYRLPQPSLKAIIIVIGVGAVGNTIGAVLFKLSKIFKEKWQFCGEVSLKNLNLGVKVDGN